MDDLQIYNNIKSDHRLYEYLFYVLTPSIFTIQFPHGHKWRWNKDWIGLQREDRSVCTFVQNFEQKSLHKDHQGEPQHTFRLLMVWQLLPGAIETHAVKNYELRVSRMFQARLITGSTLRLLLLKHPAWCRLEIKFQVATIPLTHEPNVLLGLVPSCLQSGECLQAGQLQVLQRRHSHD